METAVSRLMHTVDTSREHNRSYFPDYYTRKTVTYLSPKKKKKNLISLSLLGVVVAGSVLVALSASKEDTPSTSESTSVSDGSTNSGPTLGTSRTTGYSIPLFTTNDFGGDWAWDPKARSARESRLSRAVNPLDLRNGTGAQLSRAVGHVSQVIEAIDDEPILVDISLKIIQWGRKYGIRIFLDLHALPGSQNGWIYFDVCIPNSSLFILTMHGAMGITNAQRALTYLRILTEFASQDQYRDVVCVIRIVDDILWGAVGEVDVQSFYYDAYEAILTATMSGVGAGKGPYMTIHEAFRGPAIWEGLLAGADRVAPAQHPLAENLLLHLVSAWATATNPSSKAFGVALGGEFSSAINDCGLWIDGIGGHICGTGL
ncbi:glycoside hydrolase superfamily [Mycena haematopus]|nr:glycoside hydrolase superfamily [Mycena haematopus]